MVYGDDDDDELPKDRDDRADHGRTEELRDRISQEHGAERAAKVEQTELKSQVNLKQLKEELSGQKDEETRRQRDEERKAEKRSRAPRTKTQKKGEESILLTAQDNPDTDTIIVRQEQQQEVSDEEVQKEPG